MVNKMEIIIGEWVLNVAWYWIITVLILAVSSLAGAYHKSVPVVIWGWLVGGILILWPDYLEPVVLGWVGYDQGTAIFYITLILGILWGMTIIVSMYNALKSGTIQGTMFKQKGAIRYVFVFWSVFLLIMPAVALVGLDYYELTESRVYLSDVAVLGGARTENYIVSYDESGQGVPSGLLTGFGVVPIWSAPHNSDPWDTVTRHNIPSRQQMNNNVTVAGNDNIVVPNYDIYGFGGPYPVDNIYHIINMTAHDFVKTGSFLIKTDSDATDFGFVITGQGFGNNIVINYKDYGNPVNITESDDNNGGGNDDEFFYAWITIPLQMKLDVLAGPDPTMWFYLENVNASQLIYTWSIEKLDTSGAFTVEPIILLEFALILIEVVAFISLVFMTDVVDMVIKGGPGNGNPCPGGKRGKK